MFSLVVVIVGFGFIGVAVARQLRVLSCTNLCTCHTSKHDNAEPSAASYVSIDEFLSRANIFILLCLLVHTTKENGQSRYRASSK